MNLLSRLCALVRLHPDHGYNGFAHDTSGIAFFLKSQSSGVGLAQLSKFKIFRLHG